MDQSGPKPEQPSVDSGSLASALRRNWQVPVLGLALVALLAGVVAAVLTRPGPDLASALDRAEKLVETEQYVDAIEQLNSAVYPYFGTGEMTPTAQRRYHLLMARALHGGQALLDVPQRINDENAIKQFLEAERRDASLSSADLLSLAESYLALDMVERAHERIRQIPGIDRERRDGAYRQLIRHELERPDPRLESALAFLQDQLDDDLLPAEERSWVLARQAQIQIDLGFPDDAISLLLRQMPILVAEGAPGLGELYYELGRAYLAVDALAEAERELNRANDDRLLPDSSDGRAMVRLLLAHVDARLGHEDGRLERARERYQDIVERDGTTAAYRPALLGLAETAAALDELQTSFEAYDALVTEQLAGSGLRRPATEEVQRSLVQQYERQAAGGNARAALRYASLAGDLSTLTDMPTEVLLALGRAHRAVAAEVLGDAGGDPVEMVIGEGVDPATQQEAKRHLIRAAGYFNAHAERSVVDDYERYLDSLWNAATLYDRAGDKLEAIRTFNAFVQNAQGDARRPEGRFKLGQIHQSRGEYTLAADQYRGLIEERRAGGAPEVGLWADASYVPLAQCYIGDADPANDAEAKTLLGQVLDGTTGFPNRPEFSDALIELGRLHYRREQFGPAQERFTELLERFPSDRRATEVRYHLADTRRRIAAEIASRLEGVVRDSEARELRGARTDHLTEALALFERVRTDLEARPAVERSPLEEVQLRNSYFYMGDCAFDLGDYRGAIAHYGAAQRRYPRDPSVLVAMTQIVSAYLNMGDVMSARAAQERARGFFEALPEDVWDDPNLPMSRRDWERWLDSSSRLYEAASADE